MNAGPDSNPTPPPWARFQWVFLVWAALFLIRLAGPDNLMDKDQERPAAYVQDAVLNGNWTIQKDITGDVSSKPPLYTWLAGLTTWAAGRISRLTLYLPTGLATLGIVGFIFSLGRKHYGVEASCVASVSYLLSSAIAKQIALARTDAVLSLTVAWTAFEAYRAWKSGKGWTRFWIAAAFATLAKGPVGLALGAGGLLAHFWERRTDRSLRFGGHYCRGLLVYLLITGGWFGLAYLDLGQALIDKMIFRELVGHATGSDVGAIPGAHFYEPFLYFLGRFAPWSLLACLGFWRVWKHPASESTQRRFERFLFCWFFFGLAMFSLAAHVRADLIFPLLPPAAILVGSEITRWLDRHPALNVTKWGIAVVLLALGGVVVEYHVHKPSRPIMVRNASVRRLAVTLESEVGAAFPLTHVDTPYALQIYLNTVRPLVSYERAAKLLEGPNAAFLVVRDLERLQSELGTSNGAFQTLIRAPMAGEAPVHIVSNQPRLGYEASVATYFGPLHLSWVGLDLHRLSERECAFSLREESGTLTVRNDSDDPWPLRLKCLNGQFEVSQCVLGPGEKFTVTAH